MTVVVDIGNARVKWARVERGDLSSPGEALHRDDPEQALASLVRALPGEAGRVVATNVAGNELGRRFMEMAGEHWGLRPELIEPVDEQLGVTCAYADPRRLGADRWVAVLAAHHLTAGPACVIDAGTAVTLDAVDGDGQHLGGLIMVSPRFAATALNRETSGIGRTVAPGEAPLGLTLLGRTTDEAVAHGAMLGLAAAVDRAVAVVTAELGAEPLVLVTGGDGQSLLPWLETRVQYRAHLVLEGLALIAAES